jgi:hypothetical protein
MKPTTSLRPSRALAQRCLWGAAMALGCVSAQAQNADPNTIAVAFSGGDTFGSPGVVNGVLLNVEVTDEQTAQSRGFRSMSLTVDVDCRGGRERLRKAEAFDQPNLAGPPQPHGASGEGVMAEAYMGETFKTICAVHGMRLAQVGGSGGSLAVARGPTTPAEAPAPRPPAAPANPPEPAYSATPAPTPAHEPEAAAAPLAEAPRSPPASPAAAAGFLSRARVQIASSPSRAEAEAKLDRSAALIAAPLRGEVEVAMVHGKTVYRSIIAPFGSESEAREFCARARPSLDGCFVWPAR